MALMASSHVTLRLRLLVFGIVRRSAEKDVKKKEKECDITKPYLENLNEDPLLNGKVKYSLKKGLKNLIIRKAFIRS